METDVAYTLVESQLNVLSDALMESGKDPEDLWRLLAEELEVRLCSIETLTGDHEVHLRLRRAR